MLNSSDVIKNYVDTEGMHFRFEPFPYESHEAIVIILLYLSIKKFPLFLWCFFLIKWAIEKMHVL